MAKSIRKKSLIAISFALLVILLFFSNLFLEQQHIHCTKEHCSMCTQIEVSKKLKESLVGGLFLALLLTAIFHHYKKNLNTLVVYLLNTRIKNKVQMNC